MSNQQNLTGLRVAMLVADGFERVEMSEPRAALEGAGATVSLVSPITGTVASFDHLDRAASFPVDIALEDADVTQFDALVLPGGVSNPDALRVLPKAIGFVKAFADGGKPIAAICHAPWTLIEAGVARGKTLTSWPSLRTDLENAGATWVDRSVVVDGNLVTSRNPDDIPDFNRETIATFAAALERAHAPAR